MDRLLPNSKKEFFIDLDENKYYFPGDIIKGTVVLNLEKTTKTNHIRITLIGQVNVEGCSNNNNNSNNSSNTSSSPTTSNNCLQLLALPSLQVAKSSTGKAHWLAAQSHRFPFEFQLPDTDPLPSSLKLKKKSKSGVRYLITAVHDRPLVPDRLSRQTKKELRVLERIDITRPEFGARSHAVKTVAESENHKKKKDIKVALTLPRYAVVRGDILPLEINLNHYREFAREEGIKIQLIRRIYNGQNRRNLSEEKSIKSFNLDIKIPEKTQQQTIHTKLLIPTHTPPTVSPESGRILAVEYAIRATINLNDPLFTLGTLTTYRQRQSHQVKLESNLLIGTYPLANLSIEDDSENEGIGSSDDESTLFSDDQSSRPSLTSSGSSSTTTSAHIVEPIMTRISSSASVIDPTTNMKKMNLHDRSSTIVDPTLRRPSTDLPARQQRHSFATRPPQQGSASSLTVVEPTPPPVRDRRHSHHPTPSRIGSTTVIDPTLLRQQHHSSYHARPSHIRPQGSPTGSVTTIEPGQRYDLKKPDSRSPPHSPYWHPPPTPMASMPDISEYVPLKQGGHPQQKKRPPLHIHPVSHSPASYTTTPTSYVPQQQQPRYPPSSPGGFIVPPQHTHYPPYPPSGPWP